MAALTSTGVGVLAALAVAAAGSLLVARRLTDPIALTARTTGRLAAGDYTARVEQPQMGPELAALTDRSTPWRSASRTPNARGSS